MIKNSKKTRINCWEFFQCQESYCPSRLQNKGRLCYALVGSYSQNEAKCRILRNRQAEHCRQCLFFLHLDKESDLIRKELKAKIARLAQAEQEQVEINPAEKSRILKERALILSQDINGPGDRETKDVRKTLTFYCRNDYYGLEISYAREVCRVKWITPIPEIPRHFLGLANIRGNFLTVIDLGVMLGFNSERPVTEDYVILIIEHENKQLGLAIDRVADIISIPETELINTSHKELIKGEVFYQDRLLSIIDMEKLLNLKQMVMEAQG